MGHPVSLARLNGARLSGARLSGTVFVAETQTLYVGPLVATARHAHHAAQILVAPRGVSVEDEAGRRVHTSVAVLPPRVVHGHGACDLAAMLFLDGDDPASRALATSAESASATWCRAALEVAIPSAPTVEDARHLLTAILAVVDPNERPIPRHPAAWRMCSSLARSPDTASASAPGLAALAYDAGLSPRQMRHAFARDVGLPMRAYVRWKRLRRAMEAVAAGATLSAAAIEGGFADSAHLSRVFRAHFGMTPTQGLRSVTWRVLG